MSAAWCAERHFEFVHVDTVGRYLIGRQERDHCGNLHLGRPDRERTEEKVEKVVFREANVRADFSVERHS